MTSNEYQCLAMRTNNMEATSSLLDFITYRTDNRPYRPGEILEACLGLSGEIGELNDIIKKWVFHEKELDEVHLKKELGDVMWYVSLMCHAFDWNLDDILQMNIDKLKERYPDGFDKDRANHRESGDV